VREKERERDQLKPGRILIKSFNEDNPAEIANEAKIEAFSGVRNPAAIVLL